MIKSKKILLSSLTCVLAICTNLLALGKPSPLEAAFEVQGEYVGRIVAPGYPVRSGLQVVATSATSFDAYLLDGGLPGDGWDLQGRTLFQGTGSGNVAFSQAESPLVMRCMDQYPGFVFVYQGNYRIGTLRKVIRKSPTLGLAPPENGIVLFGDRDNHRLKNVKINSNGTLGIGAETTDLIDNVRLHVEFKTPFEPDKTGQGRGNSGVYIQRRYEVQILDSFGLDLEPNRCGGLYRQKSADINMALPPGSWQTYDIYFFAAKFDDEGQRTQRARITVVQNGVKIHDNYELVNKTGAGRKEAPTPGPIWFQDHRDPVQFRNLWMVPIADGEILVSDLNPEYGIFDVENTVESKFDTVHEQDCGCMETGYRRVWRLRR